MIFIQKSSQESYSFRSKCCNYQSGTNCLPLTLTFMNLLSDLQLSSTGRVELLRALNSKKVTKISVFWEGKKLYYQNFSITGISSRILSLVQKKTFKTNPNLKKIWPLITGSSSKITIAENVLAAAHVA